MTGTIARAAFEFSLQGAWLGAANGDGTFGTRFTVPSAETLKLDVQYIQDTAKGNSRYTALASQIVAVDWELTGVNLDANLIQIITGETASSSDTGANQVDTQTFTNVLSPYMGIMAQAWGENGADICILVPYAKMMKGWGYSFNFGKYASPNFKGTGIDEPVLGYMLQHKYHATKLTAPAFPPAWA